MSVEFLLFTLLAEVAPLWKSQQTFSILGKIERPHGMLLLFVVAS